jgi:hypothetical protein
VTTGYVYEPGVQATPIPAPAPSRVSVAFDDTALTWSPTWYGLDTLYPNLVTSYQIDRGRQFELDRTDTGRATVTIADQDGVLDPTNTSSPYVGRIEPLKQIQICRLSPHDGQWYSRFRGWIEEYDYQFDPSQRVNFLTLSCVDVFEILAAIQMSIGSFGTVPPADAPDGAADNVYYEDATMQDRILQILQDSGVPAAYSVVFSGNVRVWETTYSPGEPALDAIQEAADAEFPGVANAYGDRHGRLCVHGRYSKFHPQEVADSAGPTAWDFQVWNAGDAAAVEADPDQTTARIRRFAANRGLAKIINHAAATPVANPDGLPPTGPEMEAQLFEDTASQMSYGIRSWTAENLLTRESLPPGSDSLVETRKFAEYYVRNYCQPRNRVTDIAFRSIRPVAPYASAARATWHLLTKVDIADIVNVTVASPGGGGLDAVPYFVEGVHETVAPLNDEYDDITLTLDLSPQAYFDMDPWS